MVTLPDGDATLVGWLLVEWLRRLVLLGGGELDGPPRELVTALCGSDGVVSASPAGVWLAG